MQPDAPTPPPDSRFLRYTRSVSIGALICVPVVIALAILFQKNGLWWLSKWMGGLVVATAVVGLIAALMRLSHALWASSQYVLGELLLTFLAASVTSMIFVELMKFNLREESREVRLQGSIIAVVVITFVLFLAGSAWGWGIFRRAADFPMRRLKVLALGWVASFGLACLAFFLLLTLIFFMIGEFPREMRTILAVTFGGSVLTIPGILLERAVKRHLAQVKT